MTDDRGCDQGLFTLWTRSHVVTCSCGAACNTDSQPLALAFVTAHKDHKAPEKKA
jgi:hypothetical protein